MFDDDVLSQPETSTPAPAVPAPVPPSHEDEIPDIFDGSGGLPPADHAIDLSPETDISGPSALDVGKLQRAVSSQPPVSRDSMNHIMSGASDVSAPLHEPAAIKRIIMAAIILIVVALIGGAVWFFVVRKETPVVIDIKTPSAAVAPVDTAAPPVSEPPVIPTPAEEPVDITETPVKVPEPVIVPSAIPLPTATTQISATLDSDKDGLTDEQEVKHKTDSNNPDTDSDGLNDSAEITIWGTDPLNKDTDGDGFTDGQEVLNGFNPKGPGKAH
jgi:Bacterial TSP3 repeat